MNGQEIANVLPEDDEIVSKLRLRTTQELREFQGKLKRMSDTPRAWAIRFFIVRELSSRYLICPEERNK